MDLGLDGCNVLVSGGSKGMGRAAAECFAGEGARVAVLARSTDTLEETVARLSDLGSPDAVGLVADLTCRADVDQAFVDLAARWGMLHALVNAAGPVDVGIGDFETLSDEEWAGTFEIGVLSAVRCVRSGLPLLPRCPLGPHRERLGPLDEATVAVLGGVHRGEVRSHQPEQEPLSVPRRRRDPGKYRLTRIFPLRGDEGLSPGPASGSGGRPGRSGGCDAGYPGGLRSSGPPRASG